MPDNTPRTTIETVLGPIAPDDLGFTLSHEHTPRPPAVLGIEYPWMFDIDAMRQRGVDELTEAKQGGVDAIIDLSTPDLGRSMSLNVDYAQASGVHIVVATGIWREVPRQLRSMTPEEVADIFIREIEVGIQDTDIKAGVIKCASDQEGVAPAAEIILRAAAIASNRTGCPISTHQWAPTEVGRQQVDILKDAGADMNRVCIGHSADTTDVDYLEGLLQDGVWLSMDRYPGGVVIGSDGQQRRPTWEERNATVRALIDRGWAHRLMLGHDYAPGLQPRDYPTRYLFLSTTAIPALLADGVPQSTIDMMMREVPRAFLTGGRVEAGS
jgi:phosphotriesterase-related protein